MQNETLTNIKKQLIGTKGHFIVKLPKSKYTILCKCTTLWDIELIDPKSDVVEKLKENIGDNELKTFINNILSIDPKDISAKKLKKL